jgi:hypothetical protein
MLGNLIVRELDQGQGREKALTCDLSCFLGVVFLGLLNYDNYFLKESFVESNINSDASQD